MAFQVDGGKVGNGMILINDNLLPIEKLMEIRNGVLRAGFGTWQPAGNALFGSGKYEGMGYEGEHAPILNAITQIMGRPIFPNSMFFRVTNVNTEKRYIHSDRSKGQYTALTYLSHHPEEVSGTAFYRNLKFDLTEMPTVEEMAERNLTDELGRQMVESKEAEWERTHFVAGKFGTCLIFSAPLFHARYPENGIGLTPQDGRLIHATHFYV